MSIADPAIDLEQTLRERFGLERFRPGLLAAVLDRGPGGEVIRKAGIMTVVQSGGTVRPGDQIELALPPLPHLPLERV